MAKLFRTILFHLVAILSILPTNLVSKPLTLKQVRPIVMELLLYHIENKYLSPKLMERSFKIYIENFDQEKIYLLQSEVDEYENISSPYAKQLVKKFTKEDYSGYENLQLLFQLSTNRAKRLREAEIEHLYHLQHLDIDSIYPQNHSAYATSESELSARIRTQLLIRIKSDARSQGLKTLHQEQIRKELIMIKRSIDHHENQVLFTNISTADAENIFASQILKSIASSLDAHTHFFSPDEAKIARSSLQKQFYGIGIMMSEGIEGVYITDLVPNGPAEKSGQIKKGDHLIALNGETVEGLSFEEIKERMDDKKNKSLELTLKRFHPQEVVHVSLAKEKIILDDERVTYTYESVGDGIIGTLNLTSFYDNSRGITAEKDLRAAIRELKSIGKLKGLVLDMRSNGGGFLLQAVKVAGLFIPKGVVVISKYSNGEIQYDRDIDGRLGFQGPLVILTSKASASAAEVVAQALQDHGIALIVGDKRTYGKGTIQIQNITDARAEAIYSVTVGRFYTISGRSTQIDGAQADIVVPTAYSPYQIGEKYLRYPLERDHLGFSFLEPEGHSKKDPRSIFSSYFPKPETRWKNMLPTLVQNSKNRLKNDPSFQLFMRRSNAIRHGRDPNEYPASLERDPQMREASAIVKDMIYINTSKK